MAEVELGMVDGSDEIKVYDEVQDYLASGRSFQISNIIRVVQKLHGTWWEIFTC